MNPDQERNANPAVLIIEDDEINMEILIMALNSLGWSAIPALNGPAGLAIAKSERPRLVLCDIQMPHLDGFGVLRGLRMDAAVSDIPVIAVTAFATPVDRDRYLAAGFDAVLSKPIQMRQLDQVLREKLGAP